MVSMKFSWAKVQNIEDDGKKLNLRLSTSQKHKKQDGTEENVYSSWFATFVGNAAQKARDEGLAKDDLIHFEANAERPYRDGKNNMFITVFDYETAVATTE